MIETKVLPTSRSRTVAALAISLGFTAVAIFLPDDGGDRTWRWLCGGLFAFGSLVLAVTLFRPQRVIVEADGLTITGGLARSPNRVLWRDVERFFVWRLPRGGNVVAYDLREQARAGTWLGHVARRMGADGILPRTLRGSPAAIAAELNAYRQGASPR